MAITVLPAFRQTSAFNLQRAVTFAVLNYKGGGFRLVIIPNIQSSGQII